MPVRTDTIISTFYEITCDYCGDVEYVEHRRGFGKAIYNRRAAVRSLGWVMQRDDKVMCSTCRCYKLKGKAKC